MSFLSSESKSSIVITGGGSGIGLALAQRFIGMGHEVIIVDKDQSHLDEAKKQCSQLVGICLDIGSDQGRLQLKEQLLSAYPQVNVLVNNAALNPGPPPLKDTTEMDWAVHKQEFQVNLLAPMHLSILLLPHFQLKPNSLIVNVTSIFAFFPLANHPTYSANKAALHSFTMSMRHQLRETSIRVVELIPPLVDSPLCPSELRDRAVPIHDFVDSSMTQLLQDVVEIGYQSDKIIRGSRDELDTMFAEWNGGSTGLKSSSSEKKESSGEHNLRSSSQHSPLQHFSQSFSQKE